METSITERVRTILDAGMTSPGGGQHSLEQRLDPRGTFNARADSGQPGTWAMYALDLAVANSHALLAISAAIDKRQA